MLNLYLKLSLTSLKNEFQQKQLALYKSYASVQSGNPDQSCILSCLNSSPFQGLLKASPTVFKGLKLMKNTDLSVKIILQKC